jgi:hypothetical protein
VPVVIHRAGKVVLPTHWRRCKAYRTYRAAIAQPATFRGIIERLESQLQTSAGRTYLAADFAPSAHFARKFVHTLALSLDQNPSLAKRALKILVQIYTDAPPPRGRKTVQSVTIDEAERIQVMRKAWAEVVIPLWKHTWPDRRSFLKALEGAATFSVMEWSESRRSDMRTILARSHARPVHVINQLTAWSLMIPVRRVREGAKPGQDRDELFSA